MKRDKQKYKEANDTTPLSLKTVEEAIQQVLQHKLEKIVELAVQKYAAKQPATGTRSTSGRHTAINEKTTTLTHSQASGGPQLTQQEMSITSVDGINEEYEYQFPFPRNTVLRKMRRQAGDSIQDKERTTLRNRLFSTKCLWTLWDQPDPYFPG